MANGFSKEERVAFEQILEGFNDALVLSRAVSKYGTDQTMMERANDTIWRPMPYILTSYDGLNQASNFQDATQMSVPATIGYKKSVPWEMTATELRDALQEQRLGDSAKQRLASDVNIAVMNVASQQGTVVVTKSTAASGYSDIAACDEAFNRLGVDMNDRNAALSSADYNKLAADLAGRQTMLPPNAKAYERSYVGMVAGFDTYKLDYANRITAQTGTFVINGDDQYHTPVATSTATTGEVSNVDNRYMDLDITASAGSTLKVGDCFTITGVNEVHHITKGDTGELKTFRVISIVSGGGGTGTIRISPAIISGEGATDAELQYKNVTATPANGAAINILNTTAAPINPFWHKDAIEILPGRYAVPTDAGLAVMRGTTDQGLELIMTKQSSIDALNTKFRLDCFFGVVNKQPEMTGILLFGQS